MSNRAGRTPTRTPRSVGRRRSPAALEPPLATTHRVRDTCFSLDIQRAARALARRYDEAFKPLGLTGGQFSLLMSLARPEPPTISQVSAVLAMDRTTLTANLKPLERRRLAEVRVDADDRRSRRLVLTAAGQRLLVDALPVWERVQAEIARLIADADRLRADLRALTSAQPVD